MRSVPIYGAEEALGSNNWVVSGAKSATGKPLLANDPHLALTAPSVWYFAQLSAPGIQMIGATLPGVPAVVLGHNTHIAWGATNTGPDVQDLYLERLDGAGDYLTSSLRTSEVAALVIILVEASMGLFLLEALRITHLFPRIGNLGERMRRRMLWIALTLLATLAGVEAALALMRDMLIADKQALLQSLATVQAAATDGWVAHIPTAGQMLLGFILPFALAFVAIPLESLIHSSRTVGGALLAALVRTSAFLLRFAGNVARHLSRVLIRLYDVAIVVPLLIERMVQSRPQAAAVDIDVERTHA